MAKKKEAVEFGFARDEFGFGYLPAFEDTIIPPDGFEEGAIVDGHELRSIALTNSMQALTAGPPGEGWFPVRVYDDENAFPYALWARKIDEKAASRAFAQDFLLGSLIKAATKHLKTLSKPWGEMKESEQQSVLNTVHDDCREAVRDAIDIIASNTRMTFPAAVDQVVFKDGVKCVLTMAKTVEAHSLADAEGSYVTVVIEERSKLLDAGSALKADADQKPLFDASTEPEKTASE
jgi:hypothetical protein